MFSKSATCRCVHGQPVLGERMCAILEAYESAFVITGSNILAQIICVRFLYINIWRNVGITHDDFWTR